MWSLLVAAFTAGQGQALELSYPTELGLTGVTVVWSGHEVPFVQRGDRWLTTVGIDLDSKPGDHAVTVTFRYENASPRVVREPIVVAAEQYPTTELQVEERYVELSPEDQARADREGAETTRDLRHVHAPSAIGPSRSRYRCAAPRTAATSAIAACSTAKPRAPHSGADLRATTGTPIYAANRGRVVLAKDLFFSGNAVFIDHGYGLYTTYLHLSKVDVAVGDVVERGEQLGLAGATGRVTGPHLHWGVRLLDARVDPFSLIRLGPQ